MRVFQQARLGALQYDGLSVGTGLVDLAAAFGPLPPGRVVRLELVSYETADLAAAAAFECFMLAPGAAIGALTRVTVRNYTAEPVAQFTAACGLMVPKDAAGVPWSLRLVSSGKTVDGNLVVLATLGDE